MSKRDIYQNTNMINNADIYKRLKCEIKSYSKADLTGYIRTIKSDSHCSPYSRVLLSGAPYLFQGITGIQLDHVSDQLMRVEISQL